MVEDVVWFLVITQKYLDIFCCWIILVFWNYLVSGSQSGFIAMHGEVFQRNKWLNHISIIYFCYKELLIFYFFKCFKLCDFFLALFCFIIHVDLPGGDISYTMMKRFQDLLDYDDEDVFLDTPTPTPFNLKKSSSYQYVSMTSMKDKMMTEMDMDNSMTSMKDKMMTEMDRDNSMTSMKDKMMTEMDRDISMTSMKDKMLTDMDSSLNDDVFFRDRKFVFDRDDDKLDRFSLLSSRNQAFGLHRKRSKKGSIRFR